MIVVSKLPVQNSNVASQLHVQNPSVASQLHVQNPSIVVKIYAAEISFWNFEQPTSIQQGLALMTFMGAPAFTTLSFQYRLGAISIPGLASDICVSLVAPSV